MAIMAGMAFMAPKKDDTSGSSAAPEPTESPVAGSEVSQDANPGSTAPESGEAEKLDTELDDGGPVLGDGQDGDEGVSGETQGVPHPVTGVVDEIETAISNFGHELSAEFKSVMNSLIEKAKAIL
jgi:hypothetical protein